MTKKETIESVPTTDVIPQTTGLVLRRNGPTAVTTTNGVAAPSWMSEDAGAGLESVNRFILPPRLVIAQPTSKAPLNDYAQGTALLLPSQRVVAAYDKSRQASLPIVFAPVFFFTEYTLDNPMAIHSSHGRVRERTFDHNSDLARRAKSMDAEVNTMPCPDMPSEKCRFTVRMNYFWQLFTLTADEEPYGDLCFVSMKRTEQRPAMELNTMIRQRRAAIYGNLFVAEIHRRENNKGQWYGFDFFNPPELIGPWVNDQGIYNQLKAEHNRLAEAYAASMIDTSEADADADYVDGSATTKSDF